MLTEEHQIAIICMIEDAEAQGANAIIGMWLMSSSVMAREAEMIAYGTIFVIK